MHMTRSCVHMCDIQSPAASSCIVLHSVLSWINHLISFALILLSSKMKTAYPYHTRILKILKISPWVPAKFSVMSISSLPYGLQPARLLCPWGSPGKHTEVGCHALLQGIFPTQRSNLHLLCLLHWQADALPPLVTEEVTLALWASPVAQQ